MRKAARILSALAVLGLGCQLTSLAIKNPLAEYNLYEDITRSAPASESPSSKNVSSSSADKFFNDDDMSFWEKGGNNDSKPKSKSTSPQIKPVYSNDSGRNAYLRESSKHVYSNGKPPVWEDTDLFYETPSLQNIIVRYRNSDFAGCMQECEAYVNKNPNDTLGFYYLAMCYTKVDDKENAIKAYEKVIELNDNPMIVKYATNGRNCVMGGSEKCYENVNEPEYIYPYRNVGGIDLTPIDPDTLVKRNIQELRNQINTSNAQQANSGENDKDKKGNSIKLPSFGTVQDAALDEFIDAPYGTGLSPDEDKKYKQQLLKKIQETINNGEDSLEKKQNEIRNIRDFDNKKSDLGNDKIAYNDEDIEALANDPEFIQAQREMNQLRMLLGNDKSDGFSDLTDMIPYMSGQNRKLSPEVIQAMMMKSASNMTDFNF